MATHHSMQTKNLDGYNCSRIESISSDYGIQPPPPPPPRYHDDGHPRKRRSSSKLSHHEPLPNIQILNQHHNTPTTTTTIKDKPPPLTTLPYPSSNISTPTHPPTSYRTRSITPPPSTPHHYKNGVSRNVTRSASPPSSHSQSHSQSHGHFPNGKYIKSESKRTMEMDSDFKERSPPMTAHIAQMENGKTSKISKSFKSSKSKIRKIYEITKIEEISKIHLNHRYVDRSENITDSSQSTNSMKSVRSHFVDLQRGQTTNPSTSALSNSEHVDAVDVVDVADTVDAPKSTTTSMKNTVDDDDGYVSIETASDPEPTTNSEDTVHNVHSQPIPKSVHPIRMFNALAYGLEDVIEGLTFEWMHSKYARLLQLSTYSSVMGPKVKFVWKNHRKYNDHALHRQNAIDAQRAGHSQTTHSNQSNQSHPSNEQNGNCNDSHHSNDDLKEDGNHRNRENHKNHGNDGIEYQDQNVRDRLRPELAYHELEAWIAKQTLDCTEWRTKHNRNKTAPPPFTKKTMIAPEFGVVLGCIQFDSSLRALRNRSFHQYLHHHHNQRARPPGDGVDGSYGQSTGKTQCTCTPQQHHQHHHHQFNTPKGRRGPSGYPHSSVRSNESSMAPSSSPYDHTELEDDGSPHLQCPTSSAKSCSSSRYSSPNSVHSRYPCGDTLAEYLSKFAPFSFAAGIGGGLGVSGQSVPQVPYNSDPFCLYWDSESAVSAKNGSKKAMAPPVNTLPLIDDEEDPDDVGHYSLVLAVEYKYHEKFIECLDAIEHWLYIIASQIRYLLALNKCFKCDQMEHSMKMHSETGDDPLCDPLNWMESNDDGPDRLHSIIPFMTNIVPTAIFKFDQLFSASFQSAESHSMASSASSTSSTSTNSHRRDEAPSESMSSLLLDAPKYPVIGGPDPNHILSVPIPRGLPSKISLFETWFTQSLDNRDKHKLSTMISSHLQTLGRTVFVGDNEAEIDRYISTLALFSTLRQRSLSRLSVKVDDANNVSSHYIPELFLQGMVIPQQKAVNHSLNESSSTGKHSPFPFNPSSQRSDASQSREQLDMDYNATVQFLQSSPSMRKLQEELYLAPGPSTLVVLASRSLNVTNGLTTEPITEKNTGGAVGVGSKVTEQEHFWWIRQTAMPHKFQQEQQDLLFQKLFYLRRRRRRHPSTSRNSSYFESPSRKEPVASRTSTMTTHSRTLERKRQKLQEQNAQHIPKEFTSMNMLYRTSTLEEVEVEEDESPMATDKMDKVHDDDGGNGSNRSVTASSPVSPRSNDLNDSNELNDSNHSLDTPLSGPSGAPPTTSSQSTTSATLSPTHAPHGHLERKQLTFVEASLSPMMATIVFGSFNIPQELKMTFLETQFRILLQKASEILLYIEHQQKELLAFYDATCHVMSCKEFKEQVPMEALYPQIMQKFESQLRSDLQIARQEDLYVLLSISEGFRPNLFSLMFGNPVFDIEVADILRYFLF